MLFYSINCNNFCSDKIDFEFKNVYSNSNIELNWKSKFRHDEIFLKIYQQILKFSKHNVEYENDFP